MNDYSAGEQRGWYIYDFAQSAFSTTVVTLFLGPYLTVLAKAAADAARHGAPAGHRRRRSQLLELHGQPVGHPSGGFSADGGRVADYGRRKKEVLGAMAYLGAAATMAMFFLQGERYLFGGVLFLIANVSFGAGVVIYNSFLAGDRATGRSRRRVVERVGRWVRGRRSAAGAEPDCCI